MYQFQYLSVTLGSESNDYISYNGITYRVVSNSTDAHTFLIIQRENNNYHSNEFRVKLTAY